LHIAIPCNHGLVTTPRKAPPSFQIIKQNKYFPSNTSYFIYICSDSDEFRRRSGSSRSDGKRWGRKDTGGGELRCCIQPDLLRNNVDKHWFFEDEQVRVNGSVFARRENFDNLLSIIPMSKFNGIHIKVTYAFYCFI
uniref:Beta/gamma crystallin 'Greek key' domain-containing protein n=1 Tax=Nippostrongylus brasiliensis TaxID=27835 RepID=A0A0N4YWM5_NIPBR